MKIFIINLEKDKDRFNNICNQLQSYNFYNYERVDAIYGKDVYHNYNTKLRPSQLGCYLSLLKTCNKIVEQNLEYGIVLEDDVTITEWFVKLEEIIKTLPMSFDVCWIGNSRGHWPRNTCNLIPSYDYDKISKYKINDFVYKIDYLNNENYNYPVGGYGLVISRKGAYKIISDINHFLEPSDMYLVKNINLEKYMTVPSIITHCYNFGSNISDVPVYLKQNPFENIWKMNEKQEKEVLNILQNFTILLEKNNINYSIIYGTMLGFARNKKLISYDDDVDIAINKKDLNKLKLLLPEIKKFCNIFKYKIPKFSNSLHFKLYPYKNSFKIKNHNFNWPFIDIFVYEVRNNSIYFIPEQKQLDVKEEFIYDYINSHNNKNKYKIQIFKDYEKILNKIYKNWNSICLTSEWDHKHNKHILYTYEFDCMNIIPDYTKQKTTTHIYKKNINIKYILCEYMYIIIFFILSIIFLVKNK